LRIMRLPYSRTLFELIGGYQLISGGEDPEFEGALRQGRNTSQHWHIERLPLDRLFYIYRRWHGSYHANGVDDLRDIEPEIDESRYRVRPHWKSDYCKDLSPADRAHPGRLTNQGGDIYEHLACGAVHSESLAARLWPVAVPAESET
jgi:hypothetical protein